MQDAYRHCEALVRESDRDRYLAALFLPEAVRKHLFALYAFNIELSLVGDRACDPLAGEARLQWWREAVSGNATAGSAANPVAAALEETITRFALPRARLAQMIEARMFDLYTEPMPSVQALNGYLNETAAPVFALAAQVAGANSAGVEAAALESGNAYGLTQTLRNFPFHASQGKIHVPVDVLKKHGVDGEEILQGKSSAGLLAALSELRGNARARLQGAEKQAVVLAGGVRHAFLPLALVEPYLSLMDRQDYEPFKTPVEIPQWRRQWTLWRAARKF
jgi:phytoene synthase